MTRESVNSYRAIDGLAESISNRIRPAESPKRGLGRPLMIVVAISNSQHLRGPTITEIQPRKMATMGRDSSLGTTVMTIDSRIITRLTKIVKSTRIMVDRIRVVTNLEIIEVTIIDNSITTVECLTRIINAVRDTAPKEIRTMRNLVRIPYINSKMMTK